MGIRLDKIHLNNRYIGQSELTDFIPLIFNYSQDKIKRNVLEKYMPWPLKKRFKNTKIEQRMLILKKDKGRGQN